MLLQRFIPPRNRTCAQLAIQATSLPVTHDPYPPKNYMHCFPPTTYNVCVNDVAWIDTPSHAKLLDMPSSTAPFSLDSAVILAFSISTDGPSSHEAFRRPEFHQHRVSGRRNQKASSIICRGLRVRSLSKDEGTAPHTHGLDGQLMMMCYYLGQHPTR